MSDKPEQIRLQLVRMGYSPIPCHGKIPAAKGWNSPDWVAKQLRTTGKGTIAEKIEKWARRMPAAITTGVRIENGLLVIDIDVNDMTAVEALMDAIGKIAPDVIRFAPSRFGGGDKLALFCRVEGEDFVRLGSRKYVKPGDPDTVYHHVEIFGGRPLRTGVCSRQFALYGPRSYADDGVTVTSEYEWAEGMPALHEMQLIDLPAITRVQSLQILDAFELYAEGLGWKRLAAGHEGDGGGEDVYDIDRETTRFDVWHGLPQISYTELEGMIFSNADIRVSPTFIPNEATERHDRCSVFWSQRHDCAVIKDWKDNSRHYPSDLAPSDISGLGDRLKLLMDSKGVKTLPPWPNFELMKSGAIKVSMKNAKLAMTWMGVECAHDVFHNKLWIGRSDASAPSAKLPLYCGEMNDMRLRALRSAMLAEFHVDFLDLHTRDAALTLAEANQFNPVAEMLDDAQSRWDGKERLDRMAVDYFNCADTPLMRQCLRKTMIAAVARVREPGCKFDTIPVFESPEGFNKSTAWLVLAGGHENFSDEAIIGKNSREVQEGLAGVWIHENAELAGMTKAEVDMVTSFASRQVDRARPAYGRFLVAQPRHSVEIGTTNADVYLQKQTGNRRFWPMKVQRSIDLAKLRRDRLQLWGEAAYLQAAGESLVLDEDLWAAAAELQEGARVADVWEDILANLKRVPEHSLVAGVKATLQGYHLVTVDARGREVVSSFLIFTHILQELYNGRSDAGTSAVRRGRWRGRRETGYVARWGQTCQAHLSTKKLLFFLYLDTWTDGTDKSTHKGVFLWPARGTTGFSRDS
jgi:Virulence-associated protein E-like domain/Bifunctional DNA primase/polymerase, N-terminal